MMTESPFSSSVGGSCTNVRDFDLSTFSNLINQGYTVKDAAPIYEELSNYERKGKADEPKLEENPDDCSEEDDEVGRVELDLSLKRSPSASAPTPTASSPSTAYKPRPLPPIPVKKMPAPNVPKPGPAKLTKNAGLPEWLEEAKQCHYLPEHCMKQLCEMVKECLMEGAYTTSSLRRS
jgi:hypothetical protein